MRGWLIGLFGLVACNRSVRMADPQEVAAANSGGPSNGDAIDTLVRRLASDPMWMNGLAPTIDLPRSATPAQVVATALQLGGFTQGRGKPFRIIANRAVRIDRETADYEAVLVETALGRKIVLLSYASNGWWTRVFDR